MSLTEPNKVSPQTILDADNLALASDLAKRRMWTAVRRAVKEAGLTAADIARILQVNRSTVSRILANPHNVSLDRASRVLRATGAYVTIGSEPVEPTPLQEHVRSGTNAETFCFRSDQPNNKWQLDFKREPAAASVSGPRLLEVHGGWATPMKTENSKKELDLA